MTSNARFEQLFGGAPRRARESRITRREMDLAASIQHVTELIMLRCARKAHELTGSTNLCLAGGVALNCVGNGRILREGPFDRVWVQPAAGDAGGSLGVALFIWHQLLGNERLVRRPDGQGGSLLGPRFSDEAIREFLDAEGARHHVLPDDDALCERVAELLDSEQVVGLFQGRMEFGPRALGCRSILGDPRSREMQSVMNLKIKFRESFRPFAPSVLRERVGDWFDMRAEEDSPYMLIVAPVATAHRKELGEPELALDGLEKLKVARSDIPAVTHVDGSARVQTVDEERHGLYWRIIRAFESRTGCPMVINTSFNVRGEPIVCTPADAYRCFRTTNMDALVLGRHLVLKAEQEEASVGEVEEHLAKFALD